VLMLLKQALGVTTEMTKELLRSLIDRLLRKIPPLLVKEQIDRHNNTCAKVE